MVVIRSVCRLETSNAIPTGAASVHCNSTWCWPGCMFMSCTWGWRCIVGGIGLCCCCGTGVGVGVSRGGDGCGCRMMAEDSEKRSRRKAFLRSSISLRSSSSSARVRLLRSIARNALVRSCARNCCSLASRDRNDWSGSSDCVWCDVWISYSELPLTSAHTKDLKEY